MSMHIVGISTAIMIPVIALTLIGFIWWNNEQIKIALGKRIQLYNYKTPIKYVQWNPTSNKTYNLFLTVENIGEYPTQIRMIKQPDLLTYSLTWNYKGQNIGINQTIPILLELKTASDFQNNTINMFIEVVT